MTSWEGAGLQGIALYSVARRCRLCQSAHRLAWADLALWLTECHPCWMDNGHLNREGEGGELGGRKEKEEDRERQRNRDKERQCRQYNTKEANPCRRLCPAMHDDIALRSSNTNMQTCRPHYHTQGITPGISWNLNIRSIWPPRAPVSQFPILGF